MKFSKLSQLFLVSSIGLLVATVFSACAITTIDYVFVACSAGSGNASAGQIMIYAVDSQSGALRTGAPTAASGGTNPVSMVVSANYANLYVANAGNSTIVHFTIGLNGNLTADSHTVTLTTTPIAMAVNSAGTYLYVVSCTAAANTAFPALNCNSNANSATLTEYALSSGVIGSAVSTKTLSLYGSYASYSGDVLVPTGLTVLANNGTNIIGNAVYVTAYDQSAYNPGCTPTPPATSCITSTANPGWVFGYTIGSSGALTALTNGPYEAGVKPSAIAATPVDHYLYVTDYAQSQLIGYTIRDGGASLAFMPSGPFKTGNEPSAITIDPRGKFIYATNSLDSTISPFSIDLATGIPTVTTNTTGSGSNSTDTQPVAIVIDPALGRFVYTANYLGNSISGFRLDSTSGSLSLNQATPYPTGAKPTAVISIPHGNYSTQAVAP
jgi:6-phosphogluconolactonase (cycloisomerase 2 family)